MACSKSSSSQRGYSRPATFCSRSRLTPRPWSSCIRASTCSSSNHRGFPRRSSGALACRGQRRYGKDRVLPRRGLWWRRAGGPALDAAGTLLAARAALDHGLAGNLAGGTHHAFADHGEGFCALNDVAIAVRKLQAERAIKRAAIIDLDVHQGNGTASIFEEDDQVFTFSMHGDRNYPLAKMRSNLDVPLKDGVGDIEYLDALRRHLPTVLDNAKADIVFYLAGVDVAGGDHHGKLNLTEEGIRARDRCTVEAVRSRGAPLAIVLAGGAGATPGGDGP